MICTSRFAAGVGSEPGDLETEQDADATAGAGPALAPEEAGVRRAVAPLRPVPQWPLAQSWCFWLPEGAPRMGGGSCAVGSVCSLWPHPSSGRSPHVPPKPLAADGISADFLWDSVPSTAPISSLSSGPSVHRSHIFTSRAALAWTWGSDGSVVRVISGLDGRGSPAGHTDKGCS